MNKSPTEIYDTILLEIERIMGKDTTTNNIELNELCKRILGRKFVGVFSSDKIPKLKKVFVSKGFLRRRLYLNQPLQALAMILG